MWWKEGKRVRGRRREGERKKENLTWAMNVVHMACSTVRDSWASTVALIHDVNVCESHSRARGAFHGVARLGVAAGESRSVREWERKIGRESSREIECVWKVGGSYMPT
jgi:hypothetical protein